MATAEMRVGPYLLVRLHRATYLRIYRVDSAETSETLGTTYQVAAPNLGIPEVWHMDCALCDATKPYPTRDRALSWLGYHRITKHPQSVEKESA